MAGPEVFFNSAEILLGYKSSAEDINNAPHAYNDKRKGFQVLVGFQIHFETL